MVIWWRPRQKNNEKVIFHNVQEMCYEQEGSIPKEIVSFGSIYDVLQVR